MKLPKRVTICEVGTRDGFQIEPDFIPTEQKIEVVNRLSEAGLPRIEVTSFVHPKVVPALRDAEAVMAGIARKPGTVYAALVPNDKGAVRALDAGVDEIHTVVSASESHNLANANMTIADSPGKLRAVGQVAARAGKPIVAGISTSFGCPFEGTVPLAQLERVVAGLADIGARGIGLADTTGMANPAQVSRTLDHLMPKFPGIEWTLHTHDTRASFVGGPALHFRSSDLQRIRGPNILHERLEVDRHRARVDFGEVLQTIVHHLGHRPKDDATFRYTGTQQCHHVIHFPLTKSRFAIRG